MKTHLDCVQRYNVKVNTKKYFAISLFSLESAFSIEHWKRELGCEKRLFYRPSHVESFFFPSLIPEKKITAAAARTIIFSRWFRAVKPTYERASDWMEINLDSFPIDFFIKLEAWMGEKKALGRRETRRKLSRCRIKFSPRASRVLQLQCRNVMSIDATWFNYPCELFFLPSQTFFIPFCQHSHKKARPMRNASWDIES